MSKPNDNLLGRVIGKRHSPNQNDAPEYYSEAMSTTDFKFDVSRSVEELILRARYEKHNEIEYLRAVIQEIQKTLDEEYRAA